MCEKSPHVVDDVERGVLIDAVMHQAKTRIGFLHHVSKPGLTMQAPDIIGNPCPRCKRLPGRFGPVAVHRDHRQGVIRTERLDHGQNPADFLLKRHRRRTWPG